LQAQRFHLADHDQVITCGVFGVGFAIKPVENAGNNWTTKQEAFKGFPQSLPPSRLPTLA
jgi:hypothetical protein